MYSNTIFLKKVDLQTATKLSTTLFGFQVAGTVIFLKIADSYGRKTLYSYGFVLISLSLGLFTTFSLFDFFWGQVAMIWSVMLMWGIFSGLIWICFADYLPDKAMGLATLGINMGRFLQSWLVPFGMNSFLGLNGVFGILGIL